MGGFREEHMCAAWSNKSKVQLPGPVPWPAACEVLGFYSNRWIRMSLNASWILGVRFLRTLDLELFAGAIFPFLGGPELPPRQVPELCLQMSVLILGPQYFPSEKCMYSGSSVCHLASSHA